MSRLTKTLLFNLIASVLASCSPAPDASSPAIYQGEVVAADDPVASFTTAQASAEGAVQCSGVLIDERTILTAAHCLKDQTVQNGLRIRRGPDAVSAPNLEVAGYLKHQEYDPHALDDYNDLRVANDVALIWLKKPVDVVPAKIVSPDLDLPVYKPESRVVIAGFGVTENTGGGALTLRKTPSELSSTMTGFKLIATDSLRHGNACHGDSGGPVLVNEGGELRLLAIMNAVIGMNGRFCDSGYAMAADLRHYADWIEANRHAP